MVSTPLSYAGADERRACFDEALDVVDLEGSDHPPAGDARIDQEPSSAADTRLNSSRGGGQRHVVEDDEALPRRRASAQDRQR